MDFKTYVLTEKGKGKSDSEMTPQELEASKEAKKTRKEKLARMRKTLGLRPLPPEEEENEEEENEEATNESTSARKWQQKQARRKAKGELGAPEGEMHHMRRLRAPNPPQTGGTGSIPYRKANVKAKRLKRLGGMEGER